MKATMATKDEPMPLVISSELHAEIERHRRLVAMLPDPEDLMVMDSLDLIEASHLIELVSGEMLASSVRQLALLQRLQSAPK